LSAPAATSAAVQHAAVKHVVLSRLIAA
jgi:hypothetical protein